MLVGGGADGKSDFKIHHRCLDSPGEGESEAFFIFGKIPILLMARRLARRIVELVSSLPHVRARVFCA